MPRAKQSKNKPRSDAAGRQHPRTAAKSGAKTRHALKTGGDAQKPSRLRGQRGGSSQNESDAEAVATAAIEDSKAPPLNTQETALVPLITNQRQPSDELRAGGDSNNDDDVCNVPDSSIAQFLSDKHPRIVPDAHAAVLKRSEIDKALSREANNMAKGVSVVPVFKNSRLSVAVLALAAGAHHGPYRNPAGYTTCKVSKGGVDCIEYCLGRKFSAVVSGGAHLLIPPYQVYSLKNRTKKQVELTLTICQSFPEFDAHLDGSSQ